jgi:hypothetical protein
MYDDVVLSGDDADEITSSFAEIYQYVYNMKMDNIRKAMFEALIDDIVKTAEQEYDFIKMLYQETGKDIVSLVN